MNNSEYIDLLKFLREQIRASAYVDADERAVLEVAGIDAPKKRLEVYLEILIGSFRERSGFQSRDINARLSRYIETESGEVFGGVEVRLDPSEEELYGVSSFELNDLAAFDGRLEVLEDVLDDIRRDVDPSPEGGRGPSL